MGAIRNLCHGHVPAAWALIALTLLMKVAIPVGFMPQMSSAGVALIVCDGMAHAGRDMAAMPDMAGHHHDHDHGPARPDAPCPFAGLTAPTLTGADPIRIMVAVAAVVAVGPVRAATLPARAIAYLRPPLRGPPVRT